MGKHHYVNSALEGRGAMHLTNHGQRRQAERCIPQFIIDALVDFGDERFLGDGCRSYSFTKTAWRRFSQYMGQAIAGNDKYRNVYLVVAEENAVVTVAWRH